MKNWNLVLLVLILILSAMTLWRVQSCCKTEKYHKLKSPMYVNCNSNCSAFAQTPNDNNLFTDFGPGSCADCLTDAYGMDTLPCNYVNNYAEGQTGSQGVLNTSNFCNIYKDIMSSCQDGLTQDSWKYASQGLKC